MPKGIFSIELPVSPDKVWKYVSNMGENASVLPGYVEHELLSKQKSNCCIKGDLGFIKKNIRLVIEIKEWTAPTTIRFQVKGLSDNFTGSGYILVEPLKETCTRLTGNLEILPAGAMGPMLTTALKSVIPKMVEEMTTAVANEVIYINKI